MAELASIVLINQLSELERVHHLINQLRHDLSAIPEPVLSALTLALDEVITNVIEHGYTDGAPHEIELKVSRVGDWLECEVSDDGVPFDPTTVAIEVQSGAEPNRIGGLGIHFVRRLVDDLHYHRDQGRNRLRLRKNLARA